jgi:hypothetical protein
MPDIDELEIFRAGDYPQGRYTAEDLRRIADNYDPAWHEAPCCVTHAGDPNDDPAGRAHGWVKRLWVRGDRLIAAVRDVPADFAEALRAGRFRKRSAAVYSALPLPDGSAGPYLRHLAWVPIPQVKGLADPAIRFDEKTSHIVIHISEPVEEMPTMPEESRNPPAPPTVPPMTPPATPVPPTNDEAETPPAGADAAPAPAPASTTPAVPAGVVENLLAEFRERAARDARLDGVAAFVAEMLRQGRLTPAEAAVEQPLMERVAGSAEFSEADAALLDGKRAEIRRRPPRGLTALHGGKQTGPVGPQPPGPDADDEIARRVSAEFAENEPLFRRLGVRRESLLALARSEERSA